MWLFFDKDQVKVSFFLKSIIKKKQIEMVCFQSQRSTLKVESRGNPATDVIAAIESSESTRSQVVLLVDEGLDLRSGLEQRGQPTE